MTEMIPAWRDGVLQPVEKLEAHRAGLRHKAVSVFVVSGEHILIQQRALGKYHTPGLWANTCCTHPYWGESPEDCAYRRLAEELGVRGVVLDQRDRIEYRAEVGNGLVEHELVDVFVSEPVQDLNLMLNPDEVMNTRWVRLDQLRADVESAPEGYTPWLRIYLGNHYESIFGSQKNQPSS